MEEQAEYIVDTKESPISSCSPIVLPEINTCKLPKVTGLIIFSDSEADAMIDVWSLRGNNLSYGGQVKSETLPDYILEDILTTKEITDKINKDS